VITPFCDGDTGEAFVATVQANIARRLPPALADRKAAAMRILTAHPQRSDRWIAGATGLAPGTVAGLRRRAGSEARAGTARIGRDGRVRPVSPAEGRRRAQQELRNRPDASLRQIAQAAGISPATVKDVRDKLRRAASPAPGTPRAASPAPGNQRAEYGKPTATTGARSAQAEHPGRGNSTRDEPNALRALSKDPSLRYTDSGRALLRLLDLQARGTSRIEALIEQAPPHCGYPLAEIAHACAKQWQALAAALERRLHSQPSRQL
jgi:hypothetical protein